MNDSLSDAEVEARFARHLQMQIEHALILLGRVPLPGMESAEPRLPEARELIDQLEALEIKTRGNLKPSERAFLAGALTELRLAYVEASRSRGKAASVPSSAEPAPAGAEGPRQGPPSTAPQPESAGEEKRKFFKSYG